MTSSVWYLCQNFELKFGSFVLILIFFFDEFLVDSATDADKMELVGVPMNRRVKKRPAKQSAKAAAWGKLLSQYSQVGITLNLCFFLEVRLSSLSALLNTISSTLINLKEW